MFSKQTFNRKYCGTFEKDIYIWLHAGSQKINDKNMPYKHNDLKVKKKAKIKTKFNLLYIFENTKYV